MGKTRRRRADDDNDDARLRAMEQKAMHGRLPTPPPGHVHDTDRDRPGRKRNRKASNQELRDLVKEYNRR